MNPLDQRIAIAESVGLLAELRNGIPTCWPTHVSYTNLTQPTTPNV